MPPFTPKEVARFFIWIAVFLLAVTAIFWMIWRAPGHKQVQPNPSTGQIVMPAHRTAPTASNFWRYPKFATGTGERRLAFRVITQY